MFDFTRNAIEKTIRDIKRIDLGVNILIQLLYIAYLIIAIATGSGFFAVNVTLLSLSLIYMIFFIIVSKYGDRKIKKLGKKIYKYSKYFLRIFTLGAAVTDLFVAENVSAFDIIFVSLMVLVFIVQIFLEIAIFVLTFRVKSFIKAVKNDLNPVSNIKKLFNREKKYAEELAYEKEEPSPQIREVRKPERRVDLSDPEPPKDIVIDAGSESYEIKSREKQRPAIGAKLGGAFGSIKNKLSKKKTEEKQNLDEKKDDLVLK